MKSPKERKDKVKNKTQKKGASPHPETEETRAKEPEAPPVAGPEEAPETSPATSSETEALKDRLLRLQADFENYRKRMLRDRAEYVRRANEQLLEELLPVLDHFEMGMETARAQKVEPSVLEGFKLVYDQLLGVLLKSGVEPIDAMDTDFDPHRHECISHLPPEHVPADRVIAQTRRGYRLGDYILRAAQVVVSSGPPEDKDVENDGEEE